MKHKTRNKTSIVPATTSVLERINPDGTVHSTIGGAQPEVLDVQDYNESIYTHSGRNGRFRPVLHTKSSIRRTPVAGDEVLPRNFTSNIGKDVRPGNIATASVNDADYIRTLIEGDLAPLITDQEWSALDARALGSMLPSMNHNVSLVNFVLELADFHFLFKSEVGPLRDRLKSFLSRLSRPQQGYPLREISQLVLFHEFALSPLISDIGKIYNDLKSLRKRMRQLELRAGTRQVRHYTLTGNAFLPGTYEDVFPRDTPEEAFASVSLASWLTQGVQQSLHTYTYRRFLVPPTYNATVRYSYRLGNVGQEISKLDALLDTLGVRGDPSIIWNAIPFSFVIDWFVNVQGFLERFAVDNLKIEIAVSDFCSSVKQTVQYRNHYLRKHAHGFSRENPYVSLVAEANRYERRVNPPKLSAAVQTSGYSGYEVFLTGALLGANLNPGRTQRT